MRIVATDYAKAIGTHLPGELTLAPCCGNSVSPVEHKLSTHTNRAAKFTRNTLSSNAAILNEPISTATCRAVAPFLHRVNKHERSCNGRIANAASERTCL